MSDPVAEYAARTEALRSLSFEQKIEVGKALGEAGANIQELLGILSEEITMALKAESLVDRQFYSDHARISSGLLRDLLDDYAWLAVNKANELVKQGEKK